MHFFGALSEKKRKVSRFPTLDIFNVSMAYARLRSTVTLSLLLRWSRVIEQHSSASTSIWEGSADHTNEGEGRLLSRAPHTTLSSMCPFAQFLSGRGLCGCLYVDVEFFTSMWETLSSHSCVMQLPLGHLPRVSHYLRAYPSVGAARWRFQCCLVRLVAQRSDGLGMSLG